METSTADMIGAMDLDSSDTAVLETPIDGISGGEDQGADITPDSDGIMPAESEGEIPDEADVEEPAAEEEPEVVKPPAVAKEEPATPEELPEGVREATINGKKEFRVTPNRWDAIYGSHKTMRELEGIAGEPITRESFDARHRAMVEQDQLYLDLFSGDAPTQAKVMDYFVTQALEAQQNGHVGVDPTIGMAQAMYDTLQTKSPAAYAHLRMRAANELVPEMYKQAQELGGEDGLHLARSVSHLARTLGIPFKKDGDIAQLLSTAPQAADPVAALRAENQKLQDQINGRNVETSTAQFKSWQKSTEMAVTSAVEQEGILGSLAAEQKAWEKFPAQWDNLVINPLNKAVRETIFKDAGFNKRVTLMDQSAKMASSAQRRQEIAGQIQQAYVARAKLAVEAHKGKILREAAQSFKQVNDASHKRHQAAQSQRGPRGPQSPTPTSLVPATDVVNPGGVFDPRAEAARLSRLLGA